MVNRAAECYEIIWTPEAFQNFLRRANEFDDVSIDFETCPDPRREHSTSPLRAEDGSCIAGIGMAYGSSVDDVRSCYVPIRHYAHTAGGKQPNARAILSMLDEFVRSRDRNPDKIIVVHNLQLELSMMLKDGVAWPLKGQIHDTMIGCRILNKGIGFKELIGLKPLQENMLGRDMSSKSDMDVWLKKRGLKPGRDIWMAPVAMAGRYGQDDAADTLIIWLHWKKLLFQHSTNWWWHRRPDRKYRLDLYELEIESAVRALMNCLRGNRVDLSLCRKQASAATTLQEVCARWIQNYLDMPTVNPGSGTQLRGILFTESFGLEASPLHLTDSFKKLPDREQVRVLSGVSKKTVVDYASLDIDALKFYEEQCPDHADLFFMLAVYRKCQTALMWFKSNVEQFGILGCADPWWEGMDAERAYHLIFHRLLTVGTKPGRMSSKDYNGQQVPKRVKMLLNAARLLRILDGFLPKSQFNEMLSMLLISQAKNDDERKSTGVGSVGDDVVDLAVKRMFIPRHDCILRDFDLCQIEMVLFANFSGNRKLCDGYGSPMTDSMVSSELSAIKAVVDGADPFDAFRGLDVERHLRYDRADKFDIHGSIAKELDIPRKDAKGINFGILYGMGKRKLARERGWSQDEGKKYLGDYHAMIPEINIKQEQIKRVLRERGYVFDGYGRRYYLPVAQSYIGLNRLIQGEAASVFKHGFVRVCDLFSAPAFGGQGMHPIMRRTTGDECRVLMCIHDQNLTEMLLKHDHGLMDFAVRSCMTAMYGYKVPMNASSERGADWDSTVDVSDDRSEAMIFF